MNRRELIKGAIVVAACGTAGFLTGKWLKPLACKPKSPKGMHIPRPLPLVLCGGPLHGKVLSANMKLGDEIRFPYVGKLSVKDWNNDSPFEHTFMRAVDTHRYIFTEKASWALHKGIETDIRGVLEYMEPYNG